MATFVDQFWLIDPFSPPPSGTTLTPSSFVIDDANNNGIAGAGGGDTIDGSDITSAYPGDTVTASPIGPPAGSPITYVGTTFYLADGRVVFTPTDGQSLVPSTFNSSTWTTTTGGTSTGSFGPPCFLPGTLIDTANGPRPVETLQPGDLIPTLDERLVPLRYVHTRVLDLAHLQSVPRHGPVCIPKGSLAPDTPQSDLYVSPQHRMLLRSPIVERMYGCDGILAPAAQLVGWNGIHRITPDKDVHYLHLLFDQHEVIWANGSPTKSLYLGQLARQGFSRADIACIAHAVTTPSTWDMQPARPLAKGKKLNNLLARHQRNERDLLNIPPAEAVARRA